MGMNIHCESLNFGGICDGYNRIAFDACDLYKDISS